MGAVLGLVRSYGVRGRMEILRVDTDDLAGGTRKSVPERQMCVENCLRRGKQRMSDHGVRSSERIEVAE